METIVNKRGLSHFNVFHFIALYWDCVFHNLKICGNQPCISQQYLLTLYLCHIFVISTIFLTFSLLLYLLWWSVNFDVKFVIACWHHKPCSYKNLINRLCSLTAPLTSILSSLSLSLGYPISWDTTILKLGQWISL